MKSLILLLLFSAISYAELIYIKIGKTTSKNKLQSVNSRLKSIGLNMNYTNKDNKYTIYSGPYGNSKLAKINLKKVKNYFPNATIVTKSKTTKSENYIKGYLDGIFIGASVGYSFLPSSHDVIQGTVDAKTPKSSGFNYALNLGYSFTDNLSISFAYSIINASSVQLSNIYSSIDYKYKIYDDVESFIGLIGGYSELTWNEAPIDEKGSSSNATTFGGTEVGVIYSGLDNFDLYTTYQFMFINQITKLQPSTGNSEIQHNYLSNLLFGIQYSF